MTRGLRSSARHQVREKAVMVEDCCHRTQAAGDAIGVSAITASELEFGARRSGRYDEEMAAVRKVLAPFKLYDYDALECPSHYGRIRHELESSGREIGALDMLIAAHALALGAVLVTNNESHFGRVSGLKVVNWLKAQ
jgi:tRNA(fMet)-specific endonuclease VapC